MKYFSQSTYKKKKKCYNKKKENKKCLLFVFSLAVLKAKGIK